MEHAAVRVDLVQLQPAGFGDAQPVTEHQQQAAVQSLVPGALHSLEQPVNFLAGEMLAIRARARIGQPWAIFCLPLQEVVRDHIWHIPLTQHVVEVRQFLLQEEL